MTKTQIRDAIVGGSLLTIRNRHGKLVSRSHGETSFFIGHHEGRAMIYTSDEVYRFLLNKVLRVSKKGTTVWV